MTSVPIGKRKLKDGTEIYVSFDDEEKQFTTEFKDRQFKSKTLDTLQKNVLKYKKSLNGFERQRVVNGEGKILTMTSIAKCEERWEDHWTIEFWTVDEEGSRSKHGGYCDWFIMTPEVEEEVKVINDEIKALELKREEIMKDLRTVDDYVIQLEKGEEVT